MIVAMLLFLLVTLQMPILGGGSHNVETTASHFHILERNRGPMNTVGGLNMLFG